MADQTEAITELLRLMASEKSENRRIAIAHAIVEVVRHDGYGAVVTLARFIQPRTTGGRD